MSRFVWFQQRLHEDCYNNMDYPGPRVLIDIEKIEMVTPVAKDQILFNGRPVGGGSLIKFQNNPKELYVTSEIDEIYSILVENGVTKRQGEDREFEAALREAQKKLQLYCEQHSGEYVGGMEYQSLMDRIDRLLGKQGDEDA